MIYFWMGPADGWNVVLAAEQKVAEGQKQGRFLSSPGDDDLPKLWERHGDVAVVNITGSLVNGSSGWMRLFGVNGYDDIAAAASAAAADPDVKALLFNVSSGGGHVHGLTEFAANLNKLSQAKPSMTYTGDTMASAAYWAGSSIHGPVMMADTAEVGSLGVLQVQRNISKQLEMEGVSVTIHRAGEMKARINPIEELTPEAKAHLDSQLADLHGMFKNAVKKNRPGMTAEMVSAATDGRTFLGKRAISAGLADSLGSFDMALKLLDRTARRKDTSSNSKGATMNLTPEQLAKMQASMMAGASYVAALEAAGVVLTPEEKTKMEADAKAAADKVAADAAIAATAKAAADEAAAKAADVKPDATALDLLKSQLLTANAEARAARDELVTFKATHQSSQANHEGLLTIARQAVAGMLIPMGGSAASADAMDAATVIAEHARVRPLFIEKFKPGQQSANPAPAATSNAKVDFLFAARTQQTKE